jgi:hypothetical protein
MSEVRTRSFLVKEGIGQKWKMQQERRSPHCTAPCRDSDAEYGRFNPFQFSARPKEYKEEMASSHRFTYG